MRKEFSPPRTGTEVMERLSKSLTEGVTKAINAAATKTMAPIPSQTAPFPVAVTVHLIVDGFLILRSGDSLTNAQAVQAADLGQTILALFGIENEPHPQTDPKLH